MLGYSLLLLFLFNIYILVFFSGCIIERGEMNFEHYIKIKMCSRVVSPTSPPPHLKYIPDYLKVSLE